jgi:hypothetical protein
VIRILAIAAAIALIGWTLFRIYLFYFRDFNSAFAIAFLFDYGGVLLGVTVYWVRIGKNWRRLRPRKAFSAGVLGAWAVGVVFVVEAGVRDPSSLDLLPLALIRVILSGVVVAGGMALCMALLLYGLRPSGEGNGLMVESIGQGTNSDRDS